MSELDHRPWTPDGECEYPRSQESTYVGTVSTRELKIELQCVQVLTVFEN